MIGSYIVPSDYSTSDSKVRLVPVNLPDLLEQFSIECCKNQNQTNYLPIRLLSQCQTVVKPKQKQK